MRWLSNVMLKYSKKIDEEIRTLDILQTNSAERENSIS